MPFTLTMLLSAALIFAARTINIAIGTLRLLLMARGRKYASALAGFAEALLFTVTIGQVIQNLNNVANIIGYSAGFAAGVLVGMFIEDRFMISFATVNVVSSQRSHEVAEAIRDAGYGATEMFGHGSEGKVGLVRAVVSRTVVNDLMTVINKADPASFVTVEETRAVRRGHISLMRS